MLIAMDQMDRYIARNVLAAIVVVQFVLLGLDITIAYIGDLGDTQGDYSALDVLLYLGMRLPWRWATRVDRTTVRLWLAIGAFFAFAGCSVTCTAPPPMMAPPQAHAQSFAIAIRTDIVSLSYRWRHGRHPAGPDQRGGPDHRGGIHRWHEARVRRG